MHEHNPDLIMALAEGTLDASDVPSAEAEIAACAECSEDLELQRLALSALDATPPVTMTAIESRRMRRDLRRELGLLPVVPAAKPQRRWFSMGALATAAALLLALVIVGPGLNLLGSGSDDSSDTVSFAAGAATTTTAASAEAAEERTFAGGESPPAADDGTTGLENGTTITPRAESTTTAAPETTTTAAAAESTLMDFGAQPNLETIREAIVELGITADTDLTQYGNELRSLGLLFSFAPADETGAVETCLATGLESIPGSTSGYALGQAPFDGSAALLTVYETGTPGAIVVAVQDAATCEVLVATS